jgi:hypothetical protein
VSVGAGEPLYRLGRNRLCNEDDLCSGTDFQQLDSSFNAAYLGHDDTEQSNIGPQCGRPTNRVCAFMFDNRFTIPLAYACLVIVGHRGSSSATKILSISFLLNGSILFGQQNTGRRTVNFGNHPELVARARAVGTQQPEALLQTKLVLLGVLRGNFSPPLTWLARKSPGCWPVFKQGVHLVLPGSPQRA